MTRGMRQRLILSLLAMLGLGFTLFTLWYSGAFLPDWILWKEREYRDELRDYRLKGKRLRITQEGELYFETPLSWKVQDVLLKDLDRDGKEELILLVWKRGSYGNHRPSWVLHDEIAHSQHIFIYKPEQERLRAIWMSSRLDIRVRELEPDGAHYLRVIEPKGRETSWGWITWGLMRVD